MIRLNELAEILKSNNHLEIISTDEGLLIKEKVDEGKVIPADLVNFVKVYEKEPNITPKGNGYVIDTTEFSGQSFMMLLMSVFGAEYDFKVTGDYQVTASPKAKEGVRESSDDTDLAELNINHDEFLYNLALEAKSAKDLEKIMLDVKDSFVDEDKINFKKVDWEEIFNSVKDESLKENKEVEEVDFLKIAQAIDEDGIEIEIHEDGLRIECDNKTEIAEKIDSMYENLDIEITNNDILVTVGE